jgi:hypothetical protein
MSERNLKLPARDELKVAILWCARMLVSFDGQPFSGPLRVTVLQPEEQEAKIIKPKGTLKGMEPPNWFALGEEGGVGVSVSELLRVLLSPDEEKLLADLLKHQPCSASSVQDRCQATIKKSEFWAVWGQLQQRELVEQGDDERYRVGPEWLARWLRARRDGGKGDRPAA